MIHHLALIAITLAVSPVIAHAEAGKLGLIGDSIAQATHADDDCGNRDVYECLEDKLQQPDPAYGFAGGDQPWSLRNMLGLHGLVDASQNGAKWRDAPRQAREVTVDSEVRAVVIHMGNNDVCQSLGSDPPPLASVEARIDETLTYLTDELPASGVVYVSSLVDIVQMRDLMVGLDHNPVFESCQALWDLDLSRVKDSAIESVCDHFFGSGCGSRGASFVLEQSYDALALLFERLDGESVLGAEGTCGNILNSASGPDDRLAARRFNIALNELMMRKAKEYGGRNGVRVRFLGGLFEEQILVEDVSTLDCFHPSRTGQRHIAEVFGSPILVRRQAIQALPSILNLVLPDGGSRSEPTGN